MVPVATKNFEEIAMPFNLRGGRPKNMGQGIYWTQRHLADTRRRASSRSAAERFNERFFRIDREFHRIYDVLADKKGNVPVVSGSKLDIALDEYSSILAYINSDPYTATQGDLSKLATRAKRILTEIAKDRGLRHEWDAKEKILTIDTRSIDLS